LAPRRLSAGAAPRLSARSALQGCRKSAIARHSESAAGGRRICLVRKAKEKRDSSSPACGGLLRMTPQVVCQHGRFGGFFRRATSLLRVVIARRGSLRRGDLDGLRKREVFRQLADNLLGRCRTRFWCGDLRQGVFQRVRPGGLRAERGELGLVKRDSSSARKMADSLRLRSGHL